MTCPVALRGGLLTIAKLLSDSVVKPCPRTELSRMLLPVHLGHQVASPQARRLRHSFDRLPLRFRLKFDLTIFNRYRIDDGLTIQLVAQFGSPVSDQAIELLEGELR